MPLGFILGFTAALLLSVLAAKCQQNTPDSEKVLSYQFGSAYLPHSGNLRLPPEETAPARVSDADASGPLRAIAE